MSELSDIAASVARALRLVDSKHGPDRAWEDDMDCLFKSGSNVFESWWQVRCRDWLLRKRFDIDLGGNIHQLWTLFKDGEKNECVFDLKCPAAEFCARAVHELMRADAMTVPPKPDAESGVDFFRLERDNAIISSCGLYRYALHRHLCIQKESKSCLFIMLNPSTADGRKDDPTIRRCIGFARSWGCDRLFVGNLFAWRATDPGELRKHGVGNGDIVGPKNHEWITAMADVVTRREEVPGPIVCAWGPKGHYMQQDDAVIGWLEDEFTLYCLGRSKDGSPRHPLMLPKTAELTK